MEIRYSLRLPRDVVTVPLVRTICRDAMNRLGVTPDCQGDVALALTEACANVARFTFADLCSNALGAADFLAIAQKFRAR